jgi:hypothetical protein
VHIFWQTLPNNKTEHQVQGFPSNATLFQLLFTILYKLSATCFSRTTIFKRERIHRKLTRPSRTRILHKIAINIHQFSLLETASAWSSPLQSDGTYQHTPTQCYLWHSHFHSQLRLF